MVDKLQAGVSVPGIEVFFRHEREHRVLVVLRGPGLDPRLSDTDPQHIGVAPLAAEPLDPEAKRTADLIAEVDAQVRRVLADEPKANVVLYRGFDTHRELPGFDDPIRAACRGGRDLPDVPRHRAPARHGRARTSRRPQ